MFAAALALSLTIPFLDRLGPERVSRWRESGWQVTKSVDKFTGEVTCRVRRGPVTYRSGLVTIALGRRVDTSNALFRVGEEGPLLASAVRFEAATLGADLQAPDRRNPSRGLVFIPARLLTGADQVWVQTRPDGPVRRVDVRRLEAAVTGAVAGGCVDWKPDLRPKA